MIITGFTMQIQDKKQEWQVGFFKALSLTSKRAVSRCTEQRRCSKFHIVPILIQLSISAGISQSCDKQQHVPAQRFPSLRRRCRWLFGSASEGLCRAPSQPLFSRTRQSLVFVDCNVDGIGHLLHFCQLFQVSKGEGKGLTFQRSIFCLLPDQKLMWSESIQYTFPRSYLGRSLQRRHFQQTTLSSMVMDTVTRASFSQISCCLCSWMLYYLNHSLQEWISGPSISGDRTKVST